MASMLTHAFGTHNIRQRSSDGYVNATDMCKAYDRKFNNYRENKSTTAYIEAVVTVAGIPATVLIETKQGGLAPEQGTWVHPRVAIHLAQWLDPVFSIAVTDWVLRFIAGDLTLIGDVTQRYDQIHGTITTTAVKIEEPGQAEHDLMIKRELALLDERAAATEEKRAATEAKRAETREKLAAIERADKESATAIERADKEITIMIKEREAAVAETLVKNQSLGLRLQAELEEKIKNNLQLDISNSAAALAAAERYHADAHLCAMFKDFALRSTINQAPTQNNPAQDANILYNLDITAIAAKMGCLAAAKKKLPSLGKAIKAEYIRRTGTAPQQVNKLVNGAMRKVYVYSPANIPWIEAIIRRMLGLPPLPAQALAPV